MASFKEVPLSTYMVKKGGSVNPAKFPDEQFDLYSIPAYDTRQPESVVGSNIGSSKKKVEPNDVLLSRIVPHIQRVWVVDQKSERRQIASGEWIIFRGNDYVPSYLRHYLLSPQFHSQFMRTVAGVGGSLLRARPEQVGEIKFQLPPIEEQRRIAAILDKADAIRQKRKSTLTLLERQIHSLFIYSMGPQSSDYNKWSLIKISDLAIKSKGAMRTGPFGSDLKHSEFVDQGVAVLGIDNAVQNKFAWGERRYITSEKYEKLKRYTVKPDDVIVTIMGTTGRSAVVPSDIPTAITTKHLATITLDKTKAEPEFISNAIHRHPSVLSQIKQQNKGAIMAGLNLGIIKDLQIPLPPINTQQAFVCELKKLRRLENKMMTALEQAETLFASLSQCAFKGEL